MQLCLGLEHNPHSSKVYPLSSTAALSPVCDLAIKTTPHLFILGKKTKVAKYHPLKKIKQTTPPTTKTLRKQDGDGREAPEVYIKGKI